MSWLGKILSVFVLIVGVAAMWFMAQVYVARNNWKKDRDAWAELYKQAETARQSEQSTYRTEKDALERQLAAETTKTKSQADMIAKLKGANDLVAAENTRLAGTIKKGDIDATDLQANLQALTDEAKKLRDRGTALEKERQQLQIDREIALKDRQTFENQAKQALSDRLVAEGKIEALNLQVAELKSTGGNANAVVLTAPATDAAKQWAGNSFGKPAAALPDGIRGTVTAYKDGYVSLSIGIDAGLTNGASLDIFRSEGGGQYLGTIVIERVYPKEAVATFKPADVRRSVAKLRVEELPKIGDTVGKVGLTGPLSIK